MPIPVYKVLKPSIFIPTEFVRIFGANVSYLTEGTIPERIIVNGANVSYITEGSIPERLVSNGAIVSYITDTP